MRTKLELQREGRRRFIYYFFTAVALAFSIL